MTRDPIIDDVRAIRETIAREHDYDIAAIFQMLVQAERESQREHASPVPPKVDPVAAAAQLGVAADNRRRSP
jgi:hypothetical protein